MWGGGVFASGELAAFINIKYKGLDMVDQNDKTYANLISLLDQIISYDLIELAERSALGSINFSSAKDMLTRIIELYKNFRALPIEVLPIGIIKEINAKVQEVANTFSQIASFSIEGVPNPSQIRDQLINRLSGDYDGSFRIIAQWSPYLSFRSADVQEKIRTANELVASSKAEVENQLSKRDANDWTKNGLENQTAICSLLSFVSLSMNNICFLSEM